MFNMLHTKFPLGTRTLPDLTLTPQPKGCLPGLGTSHQRSQWNKWSVSFMPCLGCEVGVLAGKIRERPRRSAELPHFEVTPHGRSTPGMGYTMMIVFLGYGLAFWFGMTLRYNDELNPATGELWEPGTIMAIFFCI